jgi:signal transduction histidine kinase/CheY-like chemotaxis protein
MAVLSLSHFGRAGLFWRRDLRANAPAPPGSFSALPPVAQIYVSLIILVAAALFIEFFPRSLPQPLMFATLLGVACWTSAWKVNLPLPMANGSTLSVSYAACLTTLLLLGPEQAMVIAAAGFYTQCVYKPRAPSPLYRTVFSTAVAIITMTVTGLAYQTLGGQILPSASFSLAKPLVGAVGTYFLMNTGLVAAAIALSTRRSFVGTWRHDFLWLGASYMVAGTAGCLAAVVVARGDAWTAALLMAPIYLTYRTYELFVGRLDDQRRHTDEIGRLHQETVAALGHAREAERALAGEKERLGLALAEKTRLETLREQLLGREQAARAAAEEASRLKDQFLAIVSHELRTPLNAILGWSEMLNRGQLDARHHGRAFGAIHNSAKRQAQLIEDLLDVARITSGKLRLERKSVDMRVVVRGALQVVQATIDRKSLRIVLDLDSSISAVDGDIGRLQQVALNLLSNAAKFTPDHGLISVRLHQVNSMIELAISDSGQGISSDFLPRVFERFRQADESASRAYSGLGLGLAIVKELVGAHSGTVTAASPGEGLGATFTVRLPAAARTNALDVASQPQLPVGLDDNLHVLERIWVLVVDDDEQSREVVAAHLQNHGASVLTAASAAQAYDLLQRERVDVLLADIAMPGEDGYSLIRRLRSCGSPTIAATPAAALTAFAKDDDRRKALQAGFQMHLSKPIDSAAVLSAVKALGETRLARHAC